MNTHIVFVICTGEHLAIHHREHELMRRAESLGIILAPTHPDLLFDIPNPRVDVGTIGHIDWRKSALALALIESSRFVLSLPELKIEATPYGQPKWSYQFAKIRERHDQDFKRKSRQCAQMHNFCFRRR